MPNKYLQIDGVATYVHHTGTTTLPGQPPRLEQGRSVLCLHGAGGNGHLFAELMSELGTAHTLIAFDLPGHGRSGSLDSLGSIEAMAEFTDQVLNALELESTVLVGHDMGSAIALHCASTRPARVEGLVVCSAGQGFSLPDTTVEQMRRVRDGKEKRPFDPAAFSKKTPPDIMKKAFMEGMKTDPRATFGDLVAYQQWNEVDQLSNITAPTLIVHGTDEREATRASAAALAEQIQHSQLEKIEDAGHSILMEAPSALAERIGDFLDGLPA